jgi:nitrite reductase/ring-hydroxylating ferredoxin subunit
MRFFPLEKLINLHDGYTARFQIDELSLLLLEREGERYLVEANCPHQGHALDDAAITSDCIECPRHRYCFSLSTGRLQTPSGEACRPLRVFDLVYRDNDVGVLVRDCDD